MVELPKDSALPSWSYHFFGGAPISSLVTIGGLRFRHLQIDSFGSADARGADCIFLSSAIDHVLHGYQGRLSDTNATYVDSISLSDEPMDFFDDARRTYRRMMEYEVWFVQ